MNRPLSPHLQVYKPQLTSVLSIFHRFAGFALSVGILMVTWMLIAAAQGPDTYATFTAFSTSPLGQFMLFGWTAALYYHLCNGIRHLVWDTGRWLDLKSAYRAGYAVLIVATLLQCLTWAHIWFPQYFDNSFLP